MSEELNTWGEALKDEFEKPYFKQLYNFVMMAVSYTHLTLPTIA